MTTSPTIHSLSEINRGEPIPEETLAYVAARAKSRLYNYVIEAFLELESPHELSRADLSRMLSKDPAQITRWLSGPQNWTAESASHLLLAINHSELGFHSLPIIAGTNQTGMGPGWYDPLNVKFSGADTPSVDGDYNPTETTNVDARITVAV